ncbi:hypothetical protein HanRHA438_Chr01g0006211 [Helianthus annuus]|uniref:Uncharacterized protein n=1 Tax=Helianthus annuus TaxID=4232 RepID=A0A9K3P1V6_HELAN|nr:hypothetical protein HanXRQr2_Chr01g0005651 [Helianthus annuus]KAJ0610511.1 hypothetical protein HanHA300_Chr01g0004561 [Helianthus annuus]KAJ0621222.1 hypothetical protein HanIR_Chr01g0006241 [Helianthus annuus]KAJ0625754.1 hypothetical protein HanHA89_Chr01g0005191 [Helianthus annuus]KAJ0782125.1 hypothetical protein HanLR1_Chr01g0004551 [Helianthus annuus]
MSIAFRVAIAEPKLCPVIVKLISSFLYCSTSLFTSYLIPCTSFIVRRTRIFSSVD